MSAPQNHPYHVVDQSPWPLSGALGALITTTGLIKLFHQFNPDLFFMGLLIIKIQWWRDISRESTFQGLHTIQVTTVIVMLAMYTSILYFWSPFTSSVFNYFTVLVFLFYPTNS